MLPNFKWPDPKEPSDHKLIRDVIDHKCHVIGIMEDEHGPNYSFSVGLYLHFNHPEIFIIGLGHKEATIAINHICALIEAGRRFEHKETADELFDGVKVVMVNVPTRFYGDFFGYALWFYRSIGREFPFLQVVWPDKQHRFPWDSDFDPKFKAIQPILGKLDQTA